MIKKILLFLLFLFPKVALGSFNYYVPVTVTSNTALLPSSQTNFPLLLLFTDATLKSIGNGGHVQDSNGYDIRPFSDSGLSASLTYQLEFYDAATGKVVLWIKIPTLTINYVVYLGYGDATLNSDGSSTSTWNSNFKAVYHLPNGSSLTAADSTSSGFNGTLVNTPTATTGQMNGAASFVLASSQNITNANAAVSTYPVTISAWAKLANTTFALAEERVIASITRLTTGLDEFWLSWFRSASDDRRIRMVTQASGVNFNLYVNIVFDTNWHHLVAVYTNASTFLLYDNGVQVGTATEGTPNTPASLSNTNISGFNYLTSSFYGGMDGIIDEVHFYSGSLAPDWITTEYNNQLNPTTFASLGSEVNQTSSSGLNQRLLIGVGK